MSNIFIFSHVFFQKNLIYPQKFGKFITNEYVHEYIYEHNLSLFCGFLNVSITLKKHLNPRLQRLNMSKISRLKSQNLNYNNAKTN